MKDNLMGTCYVQSGLLNHIKYEGASPSQLVEKSKNLLGSVHQIRISRNTHLNYTTAFAVGLSISTTEYQQEK